MVRAMVEQQLAQADHYVALAHKHVAAQRGCVAKLEADGRDTIEARSLLQQFERVLAAHLAKRDRLLRELHG
jgi:hypothetical protein